MLSFKPISGFIEFHRGKEFSLGTTIDLTVIPTEDCSIQFDDGFVLKSPSLASDLASREKLVSVSLRIYRIDGFYGEGYGHKEAENNYSLSAYYDGEKYLILNIDLNREDFDLLARMLEKGLLPSAVDIDLILPHKINQNHLRWDKSSDEADKKLVNCNVKSIRMAYAEVVEKEPDDGLKFDELTDLDTKSFEADSQKEAQEERFNKITESLSMIRSALWFIIIMLCYFAYKTF